MASRIRIGDEVVVISGKDRGKRGRVQKVLRDKDRVIVEGVNLITRHLKRNPQNPSAGGRVQRSAAIHISKVMPWTAQDVKGARVRFQGEGRAKSRVSARSGTAIVAQGRGKARATKAGAEPKS